MGFHNGWEVPHWYYQAGDEEGYKPSYYRTNWFEPVRRECELVLNGVGIADLSAFAKIDVTGSGATEFLDHLVANKLPPVSSNNLFLSGARLDVLKLFLAKKPSDIVHELL